MKSTWRQMAFDDAVEDLSAGNHKTPQSEYLDTGWLAIIDQGRALVGGYSNDRSRLCKVQSPAIVFGDHTRCLKFIDFPFGMGADGVKVLRPKTSALDERYLFHFLGQLRLPDGGYDRHFKYLRRESVCFPDVEEQRRIAAILDQAETLRAQRRAAIALLDVLERSMFLHMFGDTATNPKALSKLRLSDFAEISSGSTPSRTTETFFGGSIPWVKTTEVNGTAIEATEERLSDSGLKAIRGKLNPKGSVVVAMYGQGKTRGNVGLLAVDAATNQACGVIRPSDRHEPAFLFAQLKLAYDRLRALGRGGNQENLNLELLGDFEVLLPELALQREFTRCLELSNALKATHRTALARLDELFASLQHRAFRGEL